MTREEALKAVKGYLTDIIPRENYSEVEEIVSALEQEPCDDAVSREAVIEWLKAKDIIKMSSQEEMARKELKALPTVRPKEKTRHWIEHNTGHNRYYSCSECSCLAPNTEVADGVIWKLSKYCPDCGARMVKPQESENNK